MDLPLHDTDKVSSVGRCCRKAAFSLFMLVCGAMLLLAGALGIGFVHSGVKEAYCWRGHEALCRVECHASHFNSTLDDPILIGLPH